MKTFFALISGLFLLSATVLGQVPSSSVEIKGKVAGVKSGKIYLQKFYNKMFFTIGSASIENEKFRFVNKLDLPELYGLTTDTTQYPLFVFIEKDNKIEVEFDPKDFRNSKIKGSAANDLYVWYQNAPGEVKIDSLIRENPKSLASVYILYREYSYRLTPDEIEANLALIDPLFNNSQYFKVLRELVVTLRNVEVGKKAIDFSAKDTTGKEFKLSDHFGKYLLLDFWASWCGPCRRENPNLVNVYQKYKDKGFDIFAVSLDKKKENWKKGIITDKLTWTQVSDLAQWNSAPAKLYGIRAIPSNVLIDPSGTIIARNLRGEELDKKLDELLSKK